MNLVNDLAHLESLRNSAVRAPKRYLGGNGFESRPELRFFSLSRASDIMDISSLSLLLWCGSVYYAVG